MISLAATVVVAILVTVPVLTALIPMVSEGEMPYSIGVDAVFDLENVEEWELVNNLENVEGGSVVKFGSESMSMKTHSNSEIAKKALSSGAPTATVYKSDGSIAQTTVNISEKGGVMNIVMGIKAHGLLSNVTSLEMTMTNFSETSGYVIPWDCATTYDSGNARFDMRIPIVVFATTMANNDQTTVSLKFSYLSLATAKVGIDAAIGSDSIKAECKNSATNVYTIEFKNIRPADGSDGTVGKCTLESTATGMTLTSNGKRVSESLAESIGSGGIETVIGGITYLMPDEMAKGFVEAVKTLEAKKYGS